jgi:U3 small nucleolar RNA-associated protein 12
LFWFAADKTVKIWGMDFGDTHRTLHGHEDSITDVKFVRRTHNFFTASKDGTVRYWDGDRFEQILLLNGHCAEVNSLVVSRTGSFLLSASMDRSVRLWERTRDIVFLEEEREREMEKMFDNVQNRDERGTAEIVDGRRADEDEDQREDRDEVKDGPQSEAAVRKTVLSIASGDRIMEALERADQETKDIAQFVRAHGTEKKRSPNMLMMSLAPADYILWILKTIKSAELEQSLIVLPLSHIERLIYYIIILLKGGKGIELCSRVAVFLIRTHQNQVRLCLAVLICSFVSSFHEDTLYLSEFL